MPYPILSFLLALTFFWTATAEVEDDGTVFLVPLSSHDLGIARRSLPDYALQQQLSLIFGPSAKDSE